MTEIFRLDPEGVATAVEPRAREALNLLRAG